MSDRFGSLLRTLRQAMPQLLGDKGHEGMQELETSIQACVQRVLRRQTRTWISTRICDRLDGLNVHIAQVVQPKVVHAARGAHERALEHVLVELLRGLVQAVQDPLLHEALRHKLVLVREAQRLVAILQLEERKPRSIPQLVTELAVAFHTHDIQVDIAAGSCVGT